MYKMVEEEGLNITFPYLYNITIAGVNQEEHDTNVQRFIEAVQQRNLTLNLSRMVKSVTFINILGCFVDNGIIKPDQELCSLQEFPLPLCRNIGMFPYYAKEIPNFSDEVQAFMSAVSFPLNTSALTAFDHLKKELEKAALHLIDKSSRFVAECDASEVAVSAMLNQSGWPISFMSRTLQDTELYYLPVEKELLQLSLSPRNSNQSHTTNGMTQY